MIGMEKKVLSKEVVEVEIHSKHSLEAVEDHLVAVDEREVHKRENLFSTPSK